eukprot:CAMPEP_0170121530 /NCGR_PEP_ID=MMETSP0020_2-20130122/15957_1 /TAXON_ID=98059 /ORGANISM="Dinobryon sp., Strain UTEXLB2267" /LENGTH=848 /DNA_ID=CAMNT_0010351931 /DNA_START=146 /DNA_END=2692 /DNA_ORIENTATION=-
MPDDSRRGTPPTERPSLGTVFTSFSPNYTSSYTAKTKSSSGANASPQPTRGAPTIVQPRSTTPNSAPVAENDGKIESEVKRSQLGDGVILWTETFKGLPTRYQYTVESDIFRKITFTFKFDGSENFELDPSATKKGDSSSTDVNFVTPLEAVVEINPYQRSPIIVCKQVDISKGGSLRMSMSWALSSPDAEILQKFVTESEEKLQKIISSVSQIFTPCKNMQISDIVRLCDEHTTSYIDLVFPPVHESLYKVDPSITLDAAKFAEEVLRRKPIVWRRPSQYDTHPVTHTQPLQSMLHIQPKDVKQGFLSNYYFSCALSALAEHPVLVRALFPEPLHMFARGGGLGWTVGAYAVTLCIGGSWQTVIVDDYFPCVPGGGPCYTRCQNIEHIWVQLLEKAYAKLFGSYRAIKMGWFMDALVDLTGAPYKEFRFSDGAVVESLKSGGLWEVLRGLCKQKYIISAASAIGSSSSANNGQKKSASSLAKLRPAHTYSVINMATTKGGVRLAEVRSPWGQVDWTGDWSHTSELWTAEIKADVGWDDKRDSVWMKLDDLLCHFSGLSVCLCRNRELNGSMWHEARMPTEYRFNLAARGVISVPMYRLEVHEDPSSAAPRELFVSIHQQDKRIIGTPRYMDLGVTVLKATGPQQFEFVASCGNGISRQNQLDVSSLPAGSYLLVPTSACCKMEQFKAEALAAGKPLQQEGVTPTEYVVPAVLSVHCSTAFSLDPMPFDPLLLEAAMEHTVQSLGTVSDLFGDGSVTLYTFKSPGNMGISYAAKNNREAGSVCFTLDVSDSDNITSDRGVLVVDCPIAPGHFKVMLHVAPMDDANSWTCGLFCKATTIPDLDDAPPAP